MEGFVLFNVKYGVIYKQTNKKQNIKERKEENIVCSK